MNTPQHIIFLSIRNFKRISVLDAKFDPVGGLTILQGDNEAGKTSALQAFIAVMTGQLPEEPLRRGTEEGCIIAETETYKLTMVFRAEGRTTFTLTGATQTRKGKEARSVWNEFISARAFNPLAFASMSERDMVAELLRVCPVSIDLEANTRQAEALYVQRTIAGRTMDKTAGALALLTKVEGEQPDLIDVSALSGQLDAIRQQYATVHQPKIQRLSTVNDGIEQVGEAIVKHKERISNLEQELEMAKSDLQIAVKTEDERIAEAKRLAVEVAALPDLAPQADELKKQIQEAGERNTIIEEQRQMMQNYQSAEVQAEEAKTEHERIDTEYKALLTARANALKAAKFPVEGMTIDEKNCVRLGGTLVKECSTAQRLKLGVELAAAVNPNMKAAVVDEGSELDKKNLSYLKTLCEQHDLRLIVARVEAEPGDNVIELVDGKAIEG